MANPSVTNLVNVADGTVATRYLAVNADGSINVIEATGGTPAATATLANVAASVSSVTLLALNALRLGAVIVNDSTSILYIKYGSTASATSYTYMLAGSVGGVAAILELPGSPRYTGIITGIWVTATGSARTTELTT